MKIKKKHPLIYGTIILTATGLISRAIGFFYRIYLSRMFGEEGMGIYQLLGPVLSLSFSLTAAGYQTTISKLVAEHSAREGRTSLRPLISGITISLPLSLLCCFVVYEFATPIAVVLLREPRTAPMLRILAFSIPLSAVHACINGYFYGIRHAGIPAASQLLEQLVRVGCVYAFSARYLSTGKPLSISIAVLGLTIGEFASMGLALISILLWCRRNNRLTYPAPRALPLIRQRSLYGALLSMALPLTANRIVLNFLQSIESVSIPQSLRAYGYDNATALSVYGVLTGMAMPFIFFPNALTSSVSILLLPTISESYALGNLNAVRSAIVRTVKYCGLMGLCCMFGFVIFGNELGSRLFNSPLAGYFIATLGFICPFLYLDTTLSGILQGLGMAGHIFTMNVICLTIRLLFVFLAVPHVGITGYLWGLLASQLTLGVLSLGCLWYFLKKHASATGSP